MKKKLSIAYFISCIVFDVLAFLFAVLLLIVDTQSGDDSARSFFIGLVTVPVMWFIISVISLKLCLNEKKKTVAVSINLKLFALLTVMGISYFFIENGIYAAILFIFIGLVCAGTGFVMTNLPQEKTQTNVIPREFLGYNAGGVWYNAAVEYLRSNNRDMAELEPKNPKQKYMIVQDFEETEYEGLTQADKDKISEYACNPIIYLVQWIVENRYISEDFLQRYNPENVQNLLNGYFPVTKFFRKDMKCIFNNKDISREIRPFLIYYYGRFIGTDLFVRDDDNYFFDYCDVIQRNGAHFFCCDYHYDIYREFKAIFDKRYSRFKELWGSSNPQYNRVSAEFPWQRFNADLEVYTYDENSQEQIKRCCEMLNNLSEKEYSKLKRIISNDYENDEFKIDFEKMFQPKTVHIFKANENDVYCFVSGEAEFECEHGIGFSILNGIVLSVGYAADLCTPYSRKEKDLYALGNNDIDFLSLTEQGAVDEYISAGKLVSFKMELDEMVAMDEENKDKCIYITPAAEKILLEDIQRLKTMCKVGLITNISISCKKEDEVLVPSVIFARGFTTVEENGEKKRKCKYLDYINVWR